MNNSNNNTQNITKILPLFGNPVLKKTKRDRMLNKYNVNMLNSMSSKDNSSNKNSKLIKLSNVLGLYLKGLNLYNYHLNKYIDNTNKKDLILYLKEQQTKKLQNLKSNTVVTVQKENNTFNFRISNILNILTSYINTYQTNSFYPIKTKNQKGKNKINNEITPSSFSFSLLNKKNKKNKNKNKNISSHYATNLNLTLNRKKELLKRLSIQPISSILIKNNPLINKGSQGLIEKNLKFSYLDLPQKIFIKKNILNLNSTSDNFFNTLVLTKKLIKNLFALSSKGISKDVINNTSIFNLEKQNKNSKLLISNSNLNPTFGQIKINSQNKINKLTSKNLFNANISNNQRKIKGLNLLEIIVSSLIAIKVLNSKILIKKNKIKLLKYINLTMVTIRRNELLNNTNLNNNNNYIIPHQNKVIPVVYNNKFNPIINQYIKAMTIFNSNSTDSKSNKGSIFSFSSIIGYNFLSKNNKLIKNVYKFLSTSFYSMYCLISKPVFVITPDKIIIQLFYYLFIPNLFKHKIRNIKKFKNRILNRNRFNKFSAFNQNKFRFSNKFKYKKIKKTQRKIFRKLSNISLINLYPNKFKKICLILSRFFKKPVELDLIRLHYPYNDSNILVNLLGIMINKVKIRIIVRKLFRKAIIKNPNKLSNKNLTILPAFLSGMNIRIAGRLLTQKVIPRITVKTIRRGALAKSKVNFSDVARLTKKNKRGAFSITISSGQNFN